MTGWRLGYGLVPTWLTQTMTRLMVNSNSCTASFTQMAGVAALEGPQTCVETMLAEFTQRREVVVAGLNQLPGVSCAPPQGAFYAFPDIRGTGYSSRELADKLLYQGGVAVLAGASFGEAGEGFAPILRQLPG